MKYGSVNYKYIVSLRLGSEQVFMRICEQVAIEEASRDLSRRREQDFVGQMLWQQQLRSTEFFSRWIELKERGAGQGNQEYRTVKT